MKRVLSFLLVIVMVFGIFNCVDFSTFASNVVGTVDYSNLTPNQYISKLLLNYNYLGSANDYNQAEKTAESQQLELMMNPNNVSFARILVNALEDNTEFMNSVGAWKLATFDPSNTSEEVFKEEDYYATILLSILDAKISNNQFIKDLNCNTNKMITSLSKNTATILKEIASIDTENLNSIKVENLTDKQFSTLLTQIGEMDDTKLFYESIGNDIGYIADAVKACKNIEQVVKTISMYANLNDVSESTIAVLKTIYHNSPENNAPMRSAAKKVYEYATGALSNNMLAMMESGKVVINYGFEKIIGELWKAAVVEICGSFGTGALIGQAVGKAISNFLFSSDQTINQYYSMRALVNFEDVITQSVQSLAKEYKQDEKATGADAYLRSVELMLSTYDLGCDYTKDFAKIVYEKGFVNTIKNLAGENQSLADINSSVENQKNNIILYYALVSLNTYKYYLQEDAPALYNAIYGEDNNTGTIPITSLQLIQTREFFVGNSGSANDFIDISYSPDNHTEIPVLLWSSSNENIIHFTEDFYGEKTGDFECLAEGECDITATTIGSGVSASLHVSVGDSEQEHNYYGDFEYRILEDNTIAITKYLGNAKKVIIPSGIDGYKVSTISTTGYWDNNVMSVTISQGITIIEDKSFFHCINLESIFIPQSITNIGEYAFESCSKLQKIIIRSNNLSIGRRAFGYCSSILSAGPIGSNSNFEFVWDEKIPDNAFNCCTELVNVSIPDTISEIGEYSFEDCAKISEINFPNNLLRISYGAYRNCDGLVSIAIPDKVTYIGPDAFDDCDSLSDVYLPASIKKLYSAFHKCNNLKTLGGKDSNCNIRIAFNSISDGAFSGTELEEVYLPDTVTLVGYQAFDGCKSLKKVIIPNNDIEFDANYLNCGVFYDCPLLKTFGPLGGGYNIEYSGTTIPKLVCYGSQIEEVYIDENVDRIERQAFSGCSELHKVIINCRECYVGDYVFEGSILLSSVGPIGSNSNIEYSWSRIPDYAFYYCENIKTLIIGDGVSVRNRAFWGCRNLSTVVLETNTPELINWNAFAGCPLKTVGEINTDANVQFLWKKSIPYAAFCDLDTLESAIIPNTIEDIGEYAFVDCDNLLTVQMNTNIKSIKKSAFERCNKISSVVYEGTKEVWNCIDIKDGNDCLIKSTRYYNYHAHEEHSFEFVSIIEPTCISEGISTYRCLIGGETKEEILPLTEHQYEEKVIQAPTCTKDGYSEYLCGVCGNSYTYWRSALGHDKEVISIIEATDCAHPGYTLYKCNRCNQEFSDDYVYIDHEYEEQVIEPTCTSDGYTKYTCKGCGDYYTTNLQQALGHNFVDDICIRCGITESSLYIVNGVCGEKATFTFDKRTGDLIISGTGTMYDYRVGYSSEEVSPFTNISGIKRIIVESGITYIGKGSFKQSSVESVSLPDTLTSIGPYVFQYCYFLEEINIPSCVSLIGDSAFEGCKKLTSINIPDSITNIGISAFSGCTSLSNIHISDSVKSIKSNAFNNTAYYNDTDNWDNDVLYVGNHLIVAKKEISGKYNIKAGTKTIAQNAFYSCKQIDGIVMPDSVLFINDDAFYNSTISSVQLSKSLISIGEDAFMCCSNLEAVELFDSVKTIGKQAFYMCSNLSSINIPNSVVEIGEGAFQNCSPERVDISSLESWCSIQFASGGNANPITSGTKLFLNGELVTHLVIPDGVTSIASSAFRYYEYLTALTIPESVTSIGTYAFLSCKNLKDVYFLGSATDWREISIDSGNNSVTGARVHYQTNGDGHWNLTGSKAADCENSGFETYQCNCGFIRYFYTESALGHNNTIISVVEATDCAHPGYTLYKCNRCNQEFRGDYVYIDHEYEEQIIEPSCTSSGYTKHTCKNCGYSYTSDWISRKAHVYKKVKTYVPNCTDEGYTDYVCKYCGNDYSNNFTEALGHDKEFVRTVAPTCSEEGYTEYFCARCQEVIKEDYMECIAHQGKELAKVLPSCLKNGYTKYICNVCGSTYKADYVDALGHSFKDGVCENCGENAADLIESDHNYNDSEDKTWTISKPNATRITIQFSDATYTEEYYDYIKIYDANDKRIGTYSGNELAGKSITVEGNKLSIQLTSDGSVNGYGFALVSVKTDTEKCAHEGTDTELKNAYEATCTETGYSGDLYCANCGELISLGHEIPIDINHHSLSYELEDATCIQSGYKFYFCWNCDYTFDNRTLPATGIHNYENGICTTCGKADENYNFDEKTIHVGDEISTYISFFGRNYYKFTPQEDIALEFSSLGSEDTVGEVFDSELNLLVENDDAQDANFNIQYVFKANQTYYLGCEWCNATTGGSFDIQLKQIPTVSMSLENEFFNAEKHEVILKCGANEYALSSENGQYDFTNLIKGTYNIYYKIKNGLTVSAGQVEAYDDNIVYTESEDVYIPMGDVNGDDVIDISDLSMLLATGNYVNANTEIDLTGDSIITIDDIAVALQAQNYGKTSVSIV